MPNLAVINPAPLSAHYSGLRDLITAIHDDSLTGDDIYTVGDLCVLGSGNITTRLVETTPANVAGVFCAGHEWADPVTIHPMYNELINPDEVWIGTYQGSESDGTAGLLEAADLAAIQAMTPLEIDYNATEDVMTIRNGTTNPAVIPLGVYQGGIGTGNSIILFRWNPAVLLGQV